MEIRLFHHNGAYVYDGNINVYLYEKEKVVLSNSIKMTSGLGK